MVNPEDFCILLRSLGIDFYTGVPDSLLSSLAYFIEDNYDDRKHIIAANEGNAVAIGIGYHLATKKIPALYMQNSGLGNSINPLASLIHNEVYRIPMLLIIGWRGEPKVADEPQHIKQGKITLEQLSLLDIPYKILDENSDIEDILNKAKVYMEDFNSPYALVVRKNTFKKYNRKKQLKIKNSLTREEAINIVLQHTKQEDLIISTTGKTSRELYEIRVKNKQEPNDFLTVGGMGHASSIALGVAISTNRKVICLDGDGSLLMHMGSMAVISKVKPSNFYHVILNNEAHESVGGQSTAATDINIKKLAESIGYKKVYSVSNEDNLKILIEEFLLSESPSLLEIKVNLSSRTELGRPTSSPETNKISFMSKIND